MELEQVATPSTFSDNVSEIVDVEPMKKRRGGRPKKIEAAQEQAAASHVAAKESVVEIVEKQTDVIVDVEPLKKKMGRPKKIQVAEPKPKKKNATWLENFEKYKNGIRNNTLSAWAAQNRKEYKTGKMNEEKKDSNQFKRNASAD